jgi:hypothetical protein
MGVTSFSMKLIEKYLPQAGDTVIELGAQNNYVQPHLPAPYMREWYEGSMLNYISIDLTGEDSSIQLDLSKPLPDNLLGFSDLVTDFGTSEHVGETIEDYYQCWLNKWNLCKDGGYIISENPMTGNWPGHGKHYLGQNFYTKLSNYLGVVDEGTHPAMSNTTDGWNVWGVIQKRGDFPTFDQFKKLPIYTK